MTNIQKNEWWRGCVIYQVYPRSFQDTNGDGIGDLKGITKRLAHIAELGADAVWVSPFFKSPMDDFGYDVSDYRAIDPMFGSMADFEEMVDKAHSLGLKIMIDLVLSHTSIEHEWFKESRSNKDNAKADWYVWSDPKPDGTPPNNWLSIFGGPAWQWDARREQYYLHNFLVSQPDLNFHNIEVQDALLDVTKFWLEKGVDGFRLDTINFYFHDDQLRSNSALPIEERNATIAPSVNPYNYQEHVYSKNRPENLAFLQRIRALLDQYEDRVILGEVGDANIGLEILGEYTAGGDKAHMCYAFELLEGTPLTASRLAEVMGRVDRVASEGWACWAYSNHDTVRHTTRWELSEAAQAMYTSLMMCLKGSSCIYQGEELGLTEADISYEDLQDPYGIEFWPEFKGRDGSRTPMVWSHNEESGGFSDAKPWLPIGQGHLDRTPDKLAGDEGSLMTHYQNAIAMRKTNPALQQGAQLNFNAEGNIAYFTRKLGADEIRCAFNMSDKVAEINKLSDAVNIANDLIGSAEPNVLSLGPWEYIIARKSG